MNIFERFINDVENYGFGAFLNILKYIGCIIIIIVGIFGTDFMGEFTLKDISINIFITMIVLMFYIDYRTKKNAHTKKEAEKHI